METELDYQPKPILAGSKTVIVMWFIAFILLVAIVAYYRYRSEPEPKVDSFQDHSEITKEIIKGK